MPEPLKRVELLQPSPMQELRIAIHPLFLITPFGGEIRRLQFEQARNTLYDQLLQRFTPIQSNNVTCIMPNVLSSYSNFKTQLQEIYEAQRVYPASHQWPQLYRTMQQMSADPRNVLLVPNLIESGVQPRAVLDQLQSRGFAVTPNTIITVGGEFQNACVQIVTEKLLQLPEITQIRLDQQATQTSEYALEGVKNYTKRFVR